MELFDMGPTEVLQAFCVQFVSKRKDVSDNDRSLPIKFSPKNGLVNETKRRKCYKPSWLAKGKRTMMPANKGNMRSPLKRGPCGWGFINSLDHCQVATSDAYLVYYKLKDDMRISPSSQHVWTIRKTPVHVPEEETSRFSLISQRTALTWVLERDSRHPRRHYC
ncbi:hypothetical protein ACOSQ4_004510 [Xanthoceras sorbifolium]